eukprot:s266_g29.t1
MSKRVGQISTLHLLLRPTDTVLAVQPLAPKPRRDWCFDPCALKMAFAQKLARNVNAYGAQTQQLLQQEVAKVKDEFMQGCEEASKKGQCSYSGTFYLYQDVGFRQDYCKETAENLLKESLADLGLQRSAVTYGRTYNNEFEVSGTWTADAETSKGENIKPCSGGTNVTCPICHEHRPAVVLMPCGHVVCRDCHCSGKLRQCPMCRKMITSASQGLFMD